MSPYLLIVRETYTDQGTYGKLYYQQEVVATVYEPHQNFTEYQARLDKHKQDAKSGLQQPLPVIGVPQLRSVSHPITTTSATDGSQHASPDLLFAGVAVRIAPDPRALPTDSISLFTQHVDGDYSQEHQRLTQLMQEWCTEVASEAVPHFVHIADVPGTLNTSKVSY